MDVTMINSYNSLIDTNQSVKVNLEANNLETISEKRDRSLETEKLTEKITEKLTERITEQFKYQEKVMMDLKDVQNFLYMLIGSEILVQNDSQPTGSSVNTFA